MSINLDELARNLLDKGIVPNQHEWKVSDEQWVKHRKKEWLSVEKRLTHECMVHVDSVNGKTPKNRMRIYEKYFMKGLIPAFNPSGEVAVCLLFLLWWHPDQSDDNWQLLNDVVRHVGGLYARNHYSDSINMLIGNAGSVLGFSPAAGFEDGFLQGKEERALQFFLGRDIGSNLVLFDKEKEQNKFGNHMDVIYRGGVGMTHWLTNSIKNINRYVIWQYDTYLEYWYENLTEENLEKLLVSNNEDSNMRKKSKKREEEGLRMYLETLAGFDANSDASNFRKVFVEKVRKILNERPIPSLLKNMWEEAKA